MEYTPKRSFGSTLTNSSTRRIPYSTGGQGYLQRFQQRSNVPTYSKSYSKSTPRYNNNSRARRILSNSNKLQKERSSNFGQWISTKRQSPSSDNKANKSLFPADSKTSDDNNDPYGVTCIDSESDSELEIFPNKKIKNTESSSNLQNNIVNNSPKRSPIKFYGKENGIFETEKKAPTNVYVNRRKPIKSKLLSDLSPTKVRSAYCPSVLKPKNTLQEEKENVPVFNDESNEITKNSVASHLIGFPNYGNTCYLNAVVQSLIGLPSFTRDYSNLVNQINVGQTTLSRGLNDVLHCKQQGHVAGIKRSLRKIKECLEKVDGSFCGYKMQDANEFLTRILDTVKDEIDNSVAEGSPPQQKEPIEGSPESSSKISSSESICRTSPSSGDSTSRRTLHNTSSDGVNNSNSKRFRFKKFVKTLDNPNIRSPGNKDVMIDESNNELKHQSDLQCNGASSPIGKLNPVKNNFEFQLMESYRCLGCGEIEARKQDYFGLYVNLPTLDDEDDDIQSAVENYMQADERELTCDKCGHESVSVVTNFTILPRILVVQLKRYEYKPDLLESVKVSSKVTINRWLNLQQCSTNDVIKPSKWTSPERIPNNSNHRSGTLSIRNLSSELNICEDSVSSSSSPPPPPQSSPIPKPSTSTQSTNTHNSYFNTPNKSTTPFKSPKKHFNSKTSSLQSSSPPFKFFNTPINTYKTPVKCTNTQIKTSVTPIKSSDTPVKSLDASVFALPAPNSRSPTPVKSSVENTSDTEDLELQEVMKRSLEDIGGSTAEGNEEGKQEEDEDEELQKAIRLSLQEMGMCYNNSRKDDLGEEEEEEEEGEQSSSSPLKQSQEDTKDSMKDGTETYDPFSYQLVSIISHFGLTTTTGHYVSDVYNCDEERWFHYDDESVANISESVVLADGRQKNGYIFFYIHSQLFKDLGNQKKNDIAS